jgi:hypothetical protein
MGNYNVTAISAFASPIAIFQSNVSRTFVREYMQELDLTVHTTEKWLRLVMGSYECDMEGILGNANHGG